MPINRNSYDRFSGDGLGEDDLYFLSDPPEMTAEEAEIENVAAWLVELETTLKTMLDLLNDVPARINADGLQSGALAMLEAALSVTQYIVLPEPDDQGRE